MKEYIHGGDIYRHPDVLDYSANINPLGTPPGVIRAAKDSMERVCHYPDACQEKLKQALAENPLPCVEYVVVHELCHLLEASHNERFWAYVERYLPDWRERKQKLNESVQ